MDFPKIYLRQAHPYWSIEILRQKPFFHQLVGVDEKMVFVKVFLHKQDIP
jgi:hypothetical protein